MTYSVIARCARTGRLGIGIASYTIAIGAYCDGALRPNVGAAVTQGFPLPRNNRLATNLLAQGCTPAMAMAALAANDRHHEYRQIAIVDCEGAALAHTGRHVRAPAAQRVGAGYAVCGASIKNESVLDKMVDAFESQSGTDLEDRLLVVLEAGRDAGGLMGVSGPRPERSVAVIVWGKRDYSDFDLRVDMQEGAIAQLRRIYVDYKPTAEYYEERARHPRNAIPSMEFADMLKGQQKEAS